MKHHIKKRSIMIMEVIGFLLLIFISWADESIGLATKLIGASPSSNFREAAFETFFIILVAIPILIMTWQILKRLHYFEEFVLICSWCKKVKCHGKWISLEDYMKIELNKNTSHGICPYCVREVEDNLTSLNKYIKK